MPLLCLVSTHFSQSHPVFTLTPSLHNLRDGIGARRALGIKYKDLTPQDLREEIYQRNIKISGGKLGKSIDYLRSEGKSWGDIIESAKRPGGKDIDFNKGRS